MVTSLKNTQQSYRHRYFTIIKLVYRGTQNELDIDHYNESTLKSHGAINKATAFWETTPKNLQQIP